MSDDDLSRPVSWDEANLPRERAASLITLADGLCAIGRVRDGKTAGQFSIHNFLLRAAVEVVGEAGGETGGDAINTAAADSTSLVVMMRAGVMRRHAWYMRVHRDAAGRPRQLDLPSPIDADWEWWPNVEEIKTRLIDEPVWLSAVGESYDERLRTVALALESARLRRIESR